MAANDRGRPIRIGATPIPGPVVGLADIVVYVVVGIAAVGLAFMVMRSRMTDNEVRALRLLAVGLVANAIICGVISAPVHRYQGRIIWLLPLFFAALALSRAGQSRMRRTV